MLVGPQRFDSPPGSVCDAAFPLDHRALDALYLQPAFRERYVLAMLQTGIGYISAVYRRGWLDAHPVPGLRRVEYTSTETDPLTCHRLR